MKQLPIFAGLLFAATVLAPNARVEAATLQTTGAGSAVATVDRSATFDTLIANNISWSPPTPWGPVPLLQPGTVLGFFDPTGFDQLLVRATIAGSGDPTLQAIALDNVQVMLTNRPPAPIISGSDFVVDQVTHEPGLTVCDTIVGCQYRMVGTDNLTAGTWPPVTPPSADGWQAGGGTLTFTDPGAAGSHRRFYRVEGR